MDFHSFARKDLQALCKLNKIPANMTNIAMADALKSLETVERIEDFLKPSESVTSESSIDSPERNVVNSPKIPPTGRRTSTRRKPVGEESESVQIMTKSTRRMTRRALSGEIMEEAKADISKTPAVRSSRKTVPAANVSRVEIHTKESEVPETPAVVPNSRRKAAAVLTRRTNLKNEEEVSTAQRVYSTRRSARLTDKKLVESIPMGKEMNKAIKIDLIASEISENDLGEVSDNISVSDAGNDSQTVLFESVNTADSVGSEIVRDAKDDDDSQTVLLELVNKSDSVGSEIVRDAKDDDVQEETGDNEVDEPKAISKEAFNESDVKSESAGDTNDIDIQEETGDNHEVSNEIFYVTEVLIDENIEEKAFDMQNQILTNKGSNDLAASWSLSDTENTSGILKLEIEESLNVHRDLDSEEKAATDAKTDVLESKVEVFPMNTEYPHEQLKLETREEFNSDKDKESDVLATVVSFFGEDAEADSDFKKFDAEKEPTISEILNCNDPKENADQPEINFIDSSDELDPEKSHPIELGLEVAATDLPVQEDLIIAMGAKDANDTKPTCEQLSKSPASVKGNAFASILADDPLTNQFPSSVVGLGHIASPIHLTLVKKSSTKTPTMKRLNHVSDDKENIDNSGRKFELTKEKEKTNKKEDALNDKQRAALNEKSLRELNKMLKEKLQISNNTSQKAKEEKLIAKATKARPALQKLSENCLAVSNIEN